MGDVGSVTQRLADTEKANGDLEAVQAKLQAAGSSLNDRLAVLGEREQQAAAAEGEVQKHTAELETLEDQMAAAASKLSQRLSVLGERELEQAEIDRQLIVLRSNPAASQNLAQRIVDEQ